MVSFLFQKYKSARVTHARMAERARKNWTGSRVRVRPDTQGPSARMVRTAGVVWTRGSYYLHELFDIILAYFRVPPRVRKVQTIVPYSDNIHAEQFTHFQNLPPLEWSNVIW